MFARHPAAGWVEQKCSICPAFFASVSYGIRVNYRGRSARRYDKMGERVRVSVRVHRGN